MLSARERAAASVLATVGSGLACGWWAQGLKPRSQSRLWVERVRLLGVPLAFLSDTLLGKPHAATPCNGSNYHPGGILATNSWPEYHAPAPLVARRGVWHLLVVATCPSPQNSKSSTRDSSPRAPTQNTTSSSQTPQTQRRADALHPATPYRGRSLYSLSRGECTPAQASDILLHQQNVRHR